MSAHSSGLEVTTEKAGEAAVVRIRGEVDLRSSPELREALLKLLEERPQRIVVDLGGVGYMDSSGVGTLVELKRRLDRGGGGVVLAALQPRVRSVFEVTRLDRFFILAGTVEEALRQ